MNEKGSKQGRKERTIEVTNKRQTVSLCRCFCLLLAIKMSLEKEGPRQLYTISAPRAKSQDRNEGRGSIG